MKSFDYKIQKELKESKVSEKIQGKCETCVETISLVRGRDF